MEFQELTWKNVDNKDVGIGLFDENIASLKKAILYLERYKIKKVRLIDPPSGHKYGAPWEVPDSVINESTLRKFLLNKGYPPKDLDLAIKYSRYWEEDSGEKEETNK
jgi:hypothetical protein